ncbi:MAG TPA: DUF5696 domain-containing protein [Tissierellaceae bacterium]
MSKKMIFVVIITIIIFIVQSSIYVNAENAGQRIETSSLENVVVGTMEKIAENEYLVLYINPETTEIAVKVKRSGDFWFSNPPDREQDAIASGYNKTRLSSQLSITYYNLEGQERIMDNYNDSIVKKQFELIKIPNGIKVKYILGEMEEQAIIPEIISVERLEQFAQKLNENEKRNLLRRYMRISLSDDEEKNKELLAQYPSLEKHDLYVLRPNLSPYIIDQLQKLFEKMGYTSEDLQKDNMEHGTVQDEQEQERFKLSLEYRLEGENLVVSVPTKEIEYNEDFPITQIRVLEFFGAANQSAEGYIFVPDGSGALIYLNNGKYQAERFVSQVYGRDNAFVLSQQKINAFSVHMPVFGMKQNDKAIFAIIEDGEAFATIYADISGKINSYNYVYAEFNSLPSDWLSLGSILGANKLRLYQPRMYEGNFTIRYAFLSGEEANYVGMAKYYRNYLIEKGYLVKKNFNDSLPFYLELIGAVEKVKSGFGIPVKVPEALTTYDQAIEILEELKNADINNIKLRYVGWFNGGVNHSVPNKIRLLKELGGEKAFTRLNNYVKENQIEFFPDVAFEYTYVDKFFDGFTVNKHAVRFLDRRVVRVYEYDLATGNRDTSRWKYIVSPRYIGGIVSNFLRSAKKYNFEGISTRYLAKDVNSDFAVNRLVDRQQAKELLIQQLDKIKRNNINILADGANAYAFPYITDIINVPMHSSKFTITDEAIPFYQIVVRGYIEYAGEPINMAQGDYKKAMLKTIETGGGVYYQWIYGDNVLTKDSLAEDLYSVHYKNWLEQAISFYKEASLILNDVQGQCIADHQIVAENVYQVTFDNGKSIIVNYNKFPVYINGIKIEGENYKVVNKTK